MWPTLKNSYRESYAKEQLENLLDSCGAFWESKGESNLCTLDVVSQAGYIFQMRPKEWAPDEPGVDIKILSGIAKSFSAEATHKLSDITWTIDAEGDLTCNLEDAGECARRAPFS